MADFSRRSMIRTAALVPLAVKLGCARRVSTDRDLTVPAAVDGNVTIALAQAPELSQPGGAIIARPQGGAGYLVVNSGTGYFALTAQCPHEGCPVAWVPEDRQVECPCHGSRFAGDGTVLSPPAITDLQAYPAEADGQQNVVVHLFAGDGTFAEPVRDGKVSFPIAEFPVLANVGGVVLGRPDGFPSPLLVTRLAQAPGPDSVGAISAICSHLGCTVLPGAARLECPCHESIYDLTGKYLQGPALANLLRYAADFDGTTVTISTTLRS